MKNQAKRDERFSILKILKILKIQDNYFRFRFFKGFFIITMTIQSDISKRK